MAIFKSLKIGTTQYDIEDHRISTSASVANDTNWKTASGGTTAAASGDIYLYTSNTKYATSNGWTYITRPDGLTECWKAMSIGSVSMGDWWGNVCYADNVISQAQRTYPVTFASEPMVFYTPAATAYNFWLYTGSAGNTTVAPNRGMARASSTGTATEVVIYCHVIGVKA